MKIKNNKTHEEVIFSNDWEVVEEKMKSKIKGQKYIDLFKHWVMVNNNAFASEVGQYVKNFIYKKDKDMLFLDNSCERLCYGIGFSDFDALEDLEDGEKYSYRELVGEE